MPPISNFELKAEELGNNEPFLTKRVTADHEIESEVGLGSGLTMGSFLMTQVTAGHEIECEAGLAVGLLCRQQNGRAITNAEKTCK